MLCLPPTKVNSTKLSDEIRQVLCVHHYSIHTRRSCVDWIVQFAHFHHMRSRQDLFPPEAAANQHPGEDNR